jgi:aminoglycoside/choline kinase family phosphotransferase
MSRTAALDRWLAGTLPGRAYRLAPASADASFRRYFRLEFTDGDGTRIVMDAPPEHEDCRPFVKVAALFAKAGLNAPRVLAADFDQGFLLLTDLGQQTFLQAMQTADAATIDRLFRDAIAALVAWQRASRPGVLPDYDDALLRRELALFPEWFIGRHLGVTLDPTRQQALAQVFDRLVERALAQPRVFVHRDYMPRNLMVSQPSPGILDFQDAVFGPISYDVASLFRDAFISWDEERTLDWTIRYWEAARKAGLPVAADFSDFWRDFEWMGLQRHLKVLGIFCRLNYRDGKPAYLADLPRFLGYARAVAGRYGELSPLLALLEALDPQPVTVGNTF